MLSRLFKDNLNFRQIDIYGDLCVLSGRAFFFLIIIINQVVSYLQLSVSSVSNFQLLLFHNSKHSLDGTKTNKSLLF